MSQLLEVTPFGVMETMAYDHGSGVLTIKSEVDLSAKLDDNTERQNAGLYKGEDGAKDFWHVASIPLIVLEQWMREFKAKTGRLDLNPFLDDPEWEKFLYGRLNDGEWRKLRTGLCHI